MKLPFRFSALVFSALLAFGGCDKPDPSPQEKEQTRKQAQGKAWRELLQTLNTAPSDQQKLEALQKFVAAHPDHPDLGEAKSRLDELQRTVAAKKAFDEVKTKAVAEGDPVAIATFFAAELAHLVGDRYRLEGSLDEPVSVPTSEGLHTVERAALLRPTRVRSFLTLVLKQQVPDLVEERCFEECFNNAANKLFEKSTGPVFAERGKLNPDAVGPILEKAWVQPDDELLGVPAKTFYLAFRPTVQAYANVAAAVKTADPAAAAKKLAALDDPKAVKSLYASFSTENEIAKKTSLEERDARAIAGWWLRRQADGTAELFDAYLTKVLEAYEEPKEMPAGGEGDETDEAPAQ